MAQGDITDEKVEAIVNPANKDLAHSGGCAAAIQQAAGPIFMKESTIISRTSGPIQVGKCVF